MKFLAHDHTVLFDFIVHFYIVKESPGDNGQSIIRPALRGISVDTKLLLIINEQGLTHLKPVNSTAVH